MNDRPKADERLAEARARLGDAFKACREHGRYREDNAAHLLLAWGELVLNQGDGKS